MVRRSRPWWALLAAATMVTASLLAPMEGMAYQILNPRDPVEGGEPDEPNDGPVLGRNQPAAGLPTIILTVVVFQPIPGILIRFPMRLGSAHARHAVKVHTR